MTPSSQRKASVPDADDPRPTITLPSAEVAEDLERYGSVPVAGWAWLQSISGKFGRHARRSTYAEPLRKALEQHGSSSQEKEER